MVTLDPERDFFFVFLVFLLVHVYLEGTTGMFLLSHSYSGPYLLIC